MKNIINKLNKIMKRIEEEIRECKSYLAIAPAGKLYVAKNGKYNNWYVKKNGEIKYLSKEERNIAEKLAYKNYYEHILKEKEKEKMIINKFVIDMSKLLNKEDFFSKYAGIAELMNSEYEGEDEFFSKYKYDEKYRPEGRKVNTTLGFATRSKTERTIANRLRIKNIKYVYEPKLIINNYYYHPDFVIKHPISEEIIIWEHLGRIDNKEYFEKQWERIWNYIAAGFIPGKNLIITFESSDYPLGEELIDRMIEIYLA